MKKVVKSKVAAQKWPWWSDNLKIFNNNNSGKFMLPIHKFTWVIVIRNFAIIRPPQPLLDHHLWFHNFFHAVYLHGLHLFLQFGYFCVDFTSFCNLTNLCFVAQVLIQKKPRGVAGYHLASIIACWSTHLPSMWSMLNLGGSGGMPPRKIF